MYLYATRRRDLPRLLPNARVLTRLQQARNQRNHRTEPTMAAAGRTMTVRFWDSVVCFADDAAPANLTEAKIRTYGPKTQKSIQSPTSIWRALGDVTHATRRTLDRIGRKERHLRRLSTAARVLPRNQRRASEGNHHRLSRKRPPRNRAAGLNFARVAGHRVPGDSASTASVRSIQTRGTVVTHNTRDPVTRTRNSASIALGRH